MMEISKNTITAIYEADSRAVDLDPPCVSINLDSSSFIKFDESVDKKKHLCRVIDSRQRGNFFYHFLSAEKWFDGWWVGAVSSPCSLTLHFYIFTRLSQLTNLIFQKRHSNVFSRLQSAKWVERYKNILQFLRDGS